MIVWIASYPRSGNSLFRIALHRLYGVRSAPDPLRPRPADSRCARERNPKSHVRPSVNWSYAGPENGSVAQPFNTVAEGSVNALVGGEIRLTPGNYPENLTLQHIVTLKRNGASGIVRIGTP